MTPYARLTLLALACALGACGWTEPKNSVEDQGVNREAARAARHRARAACSSNATYDRLKQVVFDQAIRIRNDDPVNLDLLSTHTLVRVENPLVKSRDDTLDVTVCSGRLIMQIPPGAERAFAGKRQLLADIEYAAQAAADGSGLVYRIAGAEPIVSSLAGFNLKGQSYRPASAAQVVVDPDPRREAGVPKPTASRAPAIASAAPPTPPPAARAPAPVRTRRAQASSAPSFSCRSGRSRSEQMVCGSDRLAALDRTMSSQFYSRLSRSDEGTRAELRRSRDQFLTRRERCRDEDCVDRVYRERMTEIEEIASR